MVMQYSRRPQRIDVAKFFGAGDSRATLFVNATDRREDYIACFSVQTIFQYNTKDPVTRFVNTYDCKAKPRRSFAKIFEEAACG